MFVRWKKYSEIEIQAIVSHLFESRGFIIRNLHLTNRSKERGADLIASKKGEAERTAIQVKKKPSSMTITQLCQLAKRSEQIKKYIYVEEPSVDFQKELEKHSREIDFWNGEKLIRELLHGNPYLALLILVSDTQSAFYLDSIQSDLISYFKRAEGKKLADINLQNPTKELLQLLWQAKDRSCSMGKGLLMVGNMFDQTDRESTALQTNDIEYTANSFARMVQDLYISEVRPLWEFFKEISKKYPEYIEYACVERRIGTEWIMLMTFWFLLPGRVQGTLQKWEKEQEEMKSILKDFPVDDTKDDYSIFGAIHVLSKKIAQLGMGLEGIVDDMWRYATERMKIT